MAREHKTHQKWWRRIKAQFTITGSWYQLAFFMALYVATAILVFYTPSEFKELSQDPHQYSLGLSLRLAGTLLLVTSLMLVLVIYLRRFENALLFSARKLALFVTFNILALITVKIFVFIAYWYPDSNYLIYLTPISLYAVLVGLVFGSQVGMFTGFYNAIYLGMMAGGDFRLAIAIAAGAIIAVFVTSDVRRRSRPLIAGILAGVATMLVSFSLAMLNEANFFHSGVMQKVFVESMWGFVGGVASGFIITGFLPFIEYIFHVTTRISLLELSDQNQPALRALILQAPGTYVHSLIVSNLCETAAEAVGANPLLAKIGSYFHDIGKLTKPEYFVENSGPKDRHEKLTPAMSSLIILSHVKDGVEIGEEYNLPPAIIDIIEQHHGTSRVEYFYQTAVQQHNETNRGPVSEEPFRYPGPRPQSKEAGIVMLADVVEATSRSLDDPSPARIRRMAHDLIMAKLLDRQLDESHLTLTDLSAIEDQFCFVLNSMYHARIKYPVAQKDGAGQEDLEDVVVEETE